MLLSDLDEIEYEADRVPLEGVPLNISQENLHGCDCTDGCRDRTKCACWRKTFEVIFIFLFKKFNFFKFNVVRQLSLQTTVQKIQISDIVVVAFPKLSEQESLSVTVIANVTVDVEIESFKMGFQFVYSCLKLIKKAGVLDV